METPNLEYIKSLSGGNTVFENKLIAVIKIEFVVEVENYNQYLKLKDYEQAAKLVHKIKHKIGILNLSQSHQIATQFEDGLKKGDIHLQGAFSEILNTISVFLKTLN